MTAFATGSTTLRTQLSFNNSLSVKHLTFHDTSTSSRRRSGSCVSLGDVQSFMGHSSVVHTERRYAQAGGYNGHEKVNHLSVFLEEDSDACNSFWTALMVNLVNNGSSINHNSDISRDLYLTGILYKRGSQVRSLQRPHKPLNSSGVSFSGPLPESPHNPHWLFIVQ
jgi:hypothetical protein